MPPLSRKEGSISMTNPDSILTGGQLFLLVVVGLAAAFFAIVIQHESLAQRKSKDDSDG